jgi:hypothetical protein
LYYRELAQGLLLGLECGWMKSRFQAMNDFAGQLTCHART